MSIRTRSDHAIREHLGQGWLWRTPAWIRFETPQPLSFLQHQMMCPLLCQHLGLGFPTFAAKCTLPDNWISHYCSSLSFLGVCVCVTITGSHIIFLKEPNGRYAVENQLSEMETITETQLHIWDSIINKAVNVKINHHTFHMAFNNVLSVSYLSPLCSPPLPSFLSPLPV